MLGHESKSRLMQSASELSMRVFLGTFLGAVISLMASETAYLKDFQRAHCFLTQKFIS